MASIVRYGVIGTGMMGCEHLRNIMALPDATTVAIADPVPRSLEWARSALGEVGADVPVAAGHAAGADRVAAYATHHELLARDDLDAVVVASPNHTHAGVLRDIFEQRPDLHVMVEKPLGTTVEDCRDLIERRDARPAGSGIVWVALEYRYMPPVARLLAELRAGTVGTLRMLAIREHRFPFLRKVGDWNRFTANTGGTLVEKCCHFFDLMNLAVGARPVRVMASGGQHVNHLDEEYDTELGRMRADILDNAYVIVEFANGVRAMLDLCMFAEGGPNEQELVATGDRAKIEAFVPSGLLRIGDRATREVREIVGVSAATDERIGFVGFHHGASFLEHAAFVEAIGTGAAPAVTLEDGLWSVAVGAAAHRSIDEGRPVRLDEFALE